MEVVGKPWEPEFRAVLTVSLNPFILAGQNATKLRKAFYAIVGPHTERPCGLPPGEKISKASRLDRHCKTISRRLTRRTPKCLAWLEVRRKLVDQAAIARRAELREATLQGDSLGAPLAAERSPPVG